jgi:hypothetical protein
MYNTITVDRLEQIERDRDQTMADIAYQRWMKDLNVGNRYVDNTYRLQAQAIMSEWDIARFRVPDINEQCM